MDNSHNNWDLDDLEVPAGMECCFPFFLSCGDSKDSDKIRSGICFLDVQDMHGGIQVSELLSQERDAIQEERNLKSKTS